MKFTSAYRLVVWSAVAMSVFLVVVSRLHLPIPARQPGSPAGYLDFVQYPRQLKFISFVMAFTMLAVVPLFAERLIRWWLRGEDEESWLGALNLTLLPVLVAPILAVGYGPKRIWGPLTVFAVLLFSLLAARALGLTVGRLGDRRQLSWGTTVLLAALGAGVWTNGLALPREGLKFWTGSLIIFGLVGPLTVAAATLTTRRLADGVRVAAVALLPWAFAPALLTAGSKWDGTLALMLHSHPIIVMGCLTTLFWIGGTTFLARTGPDSWLMKRGRGEVVLFIALAGLMVLVTYRMSSLWEGWVGAFDFDNVTVWVHRASQGQTPFVDFWYPYGITIFFRKWLALAFGIFVQHGIFYELKKVAGMLALFLVLRAVLLSTGAAAASTAGAYLLSNVLSFPGTAFAGIRHLLVPAALTMLLVAIHRGRRALTFSAGAIGTFAFFYSIEQGIFFFLLALVLFVVQWYQKGPGLRSGAVWFLAGAVSAGLVFGGWLAAEGALGAYLSSSFMMLRDGTGPTGLPFPNLLTAFEFTRSTPEDVASFLVAPHAFFIYSFVLYSVVLLTSSSLIVQRNASWRRMLFFLLSLDGLGQLWITLNRPDPPHIAQALVPAYILATIAVYAWVRRWSLEKGYDRQPDQFVSRQCLVVTVSLWIVFFFWGGGLQQWMTSTSRHLSSPGKTEGAPQADEGIHSPVWGHISIRPERARLLKAVNNYLEDHIGSDRRLFVLSGSNAYYYLFDYLSPTRTDNLYNILSVSQMQEVIQDLQRRPPRYVLYDTRQASQDSVSWSFRVPDLWNYVMTHTALETRIGPVVVLRFRPEGWPLPKAEAKLSFWHGGASIGEGVSAVWTEVAGVRPGRYLLALKGVPKDRSLVLYWKTVDGGGFDRKRSAPLHSRPGGGLEATFYTDRLVSEIALGPLSGPIPGSLSITSVSRRYEVNFDGDTGCFPANNISECRIADGRMVITSINSDPHFFVPVPEDFHLAAVEIRMKTSKPSIGEVFSNTAEMAYSKKEWTRSFAFPVDGAGVWRTYQIDMRGNMDFSSLAALRIDPMREAGEIEVDKIVLSEEGATGAWVRTAGGSGQEQ